MTIQSYIHFVINVYGEPERYLISKQQKMVITFYGIFQQIKYIEKTCRQISNSYDNLYFMSYIVYFFNSKMFPFIIELSCRYPSFFTFLIKRRNIPSETLL